MRRRDAPLSDGPSFKGLDMETVRRCFDRREVIAAYIFGSASRGFQTPLSDIDFAYLGRNPKDEDALFDLLYECLQRVCGEGGFDLVPLRRAPLHIQFQVATEGAVVVCRDPILDERFRAEAIVRYLDFKPYRDAYFSRK